jgi:hypothetical protein
VPDDRHLFQEKNEQQVAEDLEQAEKILEGKAPPAEQVKHEAPRVVEWIEDEIDYTAREEDRKADELYMRSLLLEISLVMPEHSKLAVQAGQAGLAADFNTLGYAAKHLIKRLGGKYTYLQRK